MIIVDTSTLIILCHENLGASDPNVWAQVICCCCRLPEARKRSKNMSKNAAPKRCSTARRNTGGELPLPGLWSDDWRGAFWRHCGSRVLLWSWRITLYSADPRSKFNPFTFLSGPTIHKWKLFWKHDICNITSEHLRFQTDITHFKFSQSVNHCHSNGVVHRDLKVGFLPYTSLVASYD